jgi:hypothetical protein
MTQVHHDIEQRAPGTAHKLGLECRRDLKVHAPQCSLAKTKPTIRLYGHEFDARVRKFLHAPTAGKVPAIIFPEN